MLNVLFSCTCFIISIPAVIKCDCDLRNFRKDKIVPSIIPDLPKQSLEVEYMKNITCGETISCTMTPLPPDISFNADDGKYYTLLMLDADPPSPKFSLLSQYLHWMITNIPGKNLIKGEIQKTYFPPLPPPVFRPHRYIFLVFQQPRYLQNYKYEGSRSRFKIRKWMAQTGMTDINGGNYAWVSCEPDAIVYDMLYE